VVIAETERGIVRVRPSGAADDLQRTVPPRSASETPGARRGTVIHTLLSRLPDLDPAERRAIAEKYLRSQKLPEAEIDAIVGETLAVLQHSEFARAFSKGSRAEIPIVADLSDLGPGVRVEGRVDRLAVTDDEVQIVDFKTDRTLPDNEDAVARAYITQMALYQAAIGRIFPNRRVVCALLWTRGPRLMPLSDERLAAELLAIRSRLDPRERRP
jgi:ATP-dependent helicase/nuclease subunit A